jgi:hypothetical protein
MKKLFSGFIAGIISTLIVMVLIIPAMAESLQQIRFNMVNIELNETQITAKDQDYTLDSGVSVPNSLSYIDENGGSTTYLPLRKLAELLSLNVDWVGETGTVVLNSIDKNELEGGEDEMNEENQGNSISSLINYEIQSFANMFVVTRFSTVNTDDPIFTVLYSGTMNETEFLQYWNSLDNNYIEEQVSNLTNEIHQQNLNTPDIVLNFGYENDLFFLLARIDISNNPMVDVTYTIYQPPRTYSK